MANVFYNLTQLFEECADCRYSCCGYNCHLDPSEEDFDDLPALGASLSSEVAQDHFKSHENDNECANCVTESFCPHTICGFMIPKDFRKDLKRYWPDNCAGIDLTIALGSCNYFDDGDFLDEIPDTKHEIIQLIGTLPSAKFYRIKSFQDNARQVCGLMYAAIDYALLVRRSDTVFAGHEYQGSDFIDICDELGLDYSRDEFLKPHVSSIKVYNDLLQYTTKENVAVPETPIHDGKSSNRGGRHKVYSLKVNEKKLTECFSDEANFENFATLTKLIEDKKDWKKKDIATLAFILMHSGFIKKEKTKNFRRWASEFCKCVGVGNITSYFDKFNLNRCKIISDDACNYFENNYSFLLTDQFKDQGYYTLLFDKETDKFGNM